MSPDQALPSFNLALHPDHYQTALPNRSYPSRPITHIPWSGCSGALLFSVSQTVFSFVFCHDLTFFGPQKTTRAETRLTIAAIVQVSVFSPIYFDTYFKPLILHQFQVPIPTTASSCFDTSFLVPGAFYGVRMLIWVRLIGILHAFVFWILVFLEAQVVNLRSETQFNQAKTLWRIDTNPSVAASVWSPCFLFSFLSHSGKKENATLCWAWFWIWFWFLTCRYLFLL